jgi:tetratricopeptide (TPR) repeat protein
MRFFIIALYLLTFFGTAQRLTDDPLFVNAQLASIEARKAREIRFIDTPLWNDAVILAEAALIRNPDDPAILRFLAETYADIYWYRQSLRRYQDVQAVTELTEEDQAGFIDAAQRVSFNYYQRDDLTGAVDFHQQVLRLDPDNIRSNAWLGRLYLELDEPTRSQPYWRYLLAQNPEDRRAAYFLALAEAAARN